MHRTSCTRARECQWRTTQVRDDHGVVLPGEYLRYWEWPHLVLFASHIVTDRLSVCEDGPVFTRCGLRSARRHRSYHERQARPHCGCRYVYSASSCCSCCQLIHGTILHYSSMGLSSIIHPWDYPLFYRWDMGSRSTTRDANSLATFSEIAHCHPKRRIVVFHETLYLIPRYVNVG